MLPIGAWILHEACKQARAWTAAGMPTRTIAVNISEMQFRSKDFPDGLSAILSETGLDPDSLELDLTESALIRHPERTAFILKTLRDMGVHVSVDNFGTGKSGFRSMQKLPLDALKIDRSLVHQIAKAADGAATLGAIVNMGRSLNLRVIAAGVETADDLALLWANNCDEAQGNFFGRPVPPEQLARLLQPQRSSTASSGIRSSVPRSASLGFNRRQSHPCSFSRPNAGRHVHHHRKHRDLRVQCRCSRQAYS